MKPLLTPGGSTRRDFIARTSSTAAALAVLGTFAASTARAVTPALKFSQIPGSGDIKVLNFALALEALEADLYAQALARLTTGGKNDMGKTIPGIGHYTNAEDTRIVREFGKVEQQHRDYLIAALGSQSLLKVAPFNKAKFDFGMEKLSRIAVLKLLYTAEKTGVAAYLGAIPHLATTTYLQTAGAIQGTEARHTAVFADVINDALANDQLQVAPLASQNHGADAPLDPDAVLAAVSPFIVL